MFCHKRNLKSEVNIWQKFRLEAWLNISEGFRRVYTLKWKKVAATQNVRSQLRLYTVTVTIVTTTYLATSKPPAGASGLQSNLISAPKDDYNITWRALASENVTATANSCCHHVFHLMPFEKVKTTMKVRKIVFVRAEQANLSQMWCSVITCSKQKYNLEEI